jgi:hypothetical protein
MLLGLAGLGGLQSIVLWLEGLTLKGGELSA